MTESLRTRANRASSITSSIRSLTGAWTGAPNAEEGVDVTEAEAEAQIVEEIDEIKRYEVSKTCPQNHNHLVDTDDFDRTSQR
jgi:hypothetical protein